MLLHITLVETVLPTERHRQVPLLPNPKKHILERQNEFNIDTLGLLLCNAFSTKGGIQGRAVSVVNCRRTGMQSTTRTAVRYVQFFPVCSLRGLLLVAISGHNFHLEGTPCF